MIFNARARATNGVVGPDPIAAPATVPEALLLRLPLTPSATDAPPAVTRIVLDAPAGETLTVSVYAMDDIIQQRIVNADDPTPLLALRKFYLLQAGLVLTGGTMALIDSGRGGSFGTLYLRPTADTLTVPRDVLASSL